jgi:hypothetical protein
MFLKTLFWLAVLISVCAPASAQVFPSPDGDLTVEYDRFTDQRKVALLQLQVAEKSRGGDLDPVKLYINCGAVYRSGTNPQRPEAIGIIFEAWTLWNYEFGGSMPLYAIVDGQRREYGPFVFYRNETINGKYVSKVGGRISYSEFQELLKAKSIEMRLGKIEFVLTEKMQRKLRDFAGMITP